MLWLAGKREGLGRFQNKAARLSFLDNPWSLNQAGTRAVCGTEGTGAFQTWEAKRGGLRQLNKSRCTGLPPSPESFRSNFVKK